MTRRPKGGNLEAEVEDRVDKVEGGHNGEKSPQGGQEGGLGGHLVVRWTSRAS